LPEFLFADAPDRGPLFVISMGEIDTVLSEGIFSSRVFVTMVTV
jgi:hypothetical protein